MELSQGLKNYYLVYHKYLDQWINNTDNIVIEKKLKQTKMHIGTTKIKRKRDAVPVWEKSTLTLEEAAEYSGIGIHKLRELTDKKNCDFVLWNGHKRLIKRRKFDEYIDKSYSI